MEACFQYLVDKGLENATVKNLCKEIGVLSGSIYYWFEGRDEMILNATFYELKNVTEDLFNFAFANTSN